MKFARGALDMIIILNDYLTKLLVSFTYTLNGLNFNTIPAIYVQDYLECIIEII